MRAEFANYTFYRAWLYFEFTDLERFDPGHGWAAMAKNYLSAVFTRYYDPARRMVLDPAHQSYRTDFAAEAAAALLDGGQRYGHPEWTAAGRDASSYLVARAPNSATHLFPLEMLAGRDRDQPRQNLVKVGAEAQLLDSLLTAYDFAHDQAVLLAVTQAVTSLFSGSLGLWDASNQAFFFGIDADGSGLRDAYRETRQAWMLPLLEHLSRDQPGAYADMAPSFLSTVRDRLWQAGSQGYAYRVDTDFKTYTSDSGPGHTQVSEDFVSSEAMDIACQALESTWPQPGGR